MERTAAEARVLMHQLGVESAPTLNGEALAAKVKTARISEKVTGVILGDMKEKLF